MGPARFSLHPNSSKEREMSIQAAFDYFTQAFADPGQSAMVLPTGEAENWPALQVLAAQKGFSIAPEEARRVYRIAKSWSWYAVEPPGFGFLWKDYFGTGNVLQQALVNAAGQFMDRHEQAVLGGRPAAVDPGNDTPASVASFAGGWTVSLTDTGSFAFRQGGGVKLFVQPDGQVWSQAGGYLAAREPAPDPTGPDLRILFPPPEGRGAYGGWTLSITRTGRFALKHGGQTRLAVTEYGDVWGAAAGGYFGALAGTQGSYQPAPLNPAQQAALLAAGGFHFAGTAYGSAIHWASGAASSVAETAKEAAEAAKEAAEKVVHVFNPSNW
jgi:hypothetical protein